MAMVVIDTVSAAEVGAALLASSSPSGESSGLATLLPSSASADELSRPPVRRALRFLLAPLLRPMKAWQDGQRLDEAARVGGSSDCESDEVLLMGDSGASTPTASFSQQQQQQLPQRQRRQGPLQGLLRGVLGGLVRLARGASCHMRPKGPGINDACLSERIANLITSLPFLGVGWHTLRSRKSTAAKRFGFSFVVVGAAASLYHGCSGRWRPLARKLDYWAICASTGELRKATHVHLPRAASVCATLLTPFAPTLVTLFNLVAIETRYTRIVLQHDHLVKPWCWHMVASVVAVGSFFWEDEAIERNWPPVFHALWHCLSATAVGTATNELLNHLDG